MNLEQSVSLEALKVVPTKKPEKQRMTALQMARHVFKISAAAGHPYRNITPEQWAKKWLPSPVFVLTEVETDRVALIRTPRNINKVLDGLNAGASKREPVVVDLNKNELSSKNGFIPSVVAVDGAHRCYGEYLRGRDLMTAWVGVKALDKVRPEPLFAASSVTSNGVVGVGTKISTAATLYAAQGMPAPPRQDTGDGGAQPTGGPSGVMRSGAPDGSTFIKNRGVRAEEYSKVSKTPDSVVSDAREKMVWNVDPDSGKISPPGEKNRIGKKAGESGKGGAVKANGHKKDCKCAECREMAAGGAGGMGGPGASMGNGSGPTPKLNAKSRMEKLRARRTPEAESSGHLDEPDPSDETVPPDPSDTKPSVDPSDRLKYENEPQRNPPGVRGWDKELRGPGSPMSDSPGSGVGPRLTPNKGASNSELQRTMKAKKGCSDCPPEVDAAGKRIKKIVTKKKSRSY